jgi:hypothetical protein
MKVAVIVETERGAALHPSEVQQQTVAGTVSRVCFVQPAELQTPSFGAPRSTAVTPLRASLSF